MTSGVEKKTSEDRDIKPRLSFYTNMPTPYQLDFFDALKNYFRLTVIYFTEKENDRLWNLATEGEGYTTIVLKNGKLVKKIQRFVPSVHYSKDIKAVARKTDADMVIVNGTYWSPNVLLALQFGNKQCKKVAYWSEPVFPVRNPIKRQIKSLLLSGVRKYSTLLLAIGKKAEESFRAYNYPHQIYNIPYNINTSLFENPQLDKNKMQELQSQYKANNELVLLTSGSLIHRKGIDTVIEAYKKVRGIAPLRLLIIGDGPDRALLQQKAEGIDTIHFLGFQDKEMVPYWFNLADIFVFASRYDGWALVINEALAAGKAVVSSTAAGAAYDSLTDGVNAFLCEPEATDQYAAAIEKLIKDPLLRQEMSLNGKKTGTALSSESIAKKLYDIYRLG